MATKARKATRNKSSRKDGSQKVRFQLRAPSKSKVFVAGSFNGWDPSANRLRRNGNGAYAANIMLPPGHHEYKFVVDGEWLIDTENPAWAPNNLGSLNSVIEISEKDAQGVHVQA
jgi:1,4-alpha-glucan branching enzyme